MSSRKVALTARLAFEAEARRQSLAIAQRAGDPGSDEAAVMREIEAEIGDFAVESLWVA